MPRRPTIVLIDADAAFRDALAAYLREIGYDVRVAGSVADGAPILEREMPDLIVFDIDRAGPDGLDALRDLRDNRTASLLALTASHDPIDRVAGLETGADDVVVKPVAFQELAARIAGILDRRGIGRRDILRLETVTVDLATSRLLRYGRAPERLSPGEIVLLQTFARHPHRVLTRDDLLDMAAAESLDANDRAIDTRVARLRRKLETEAIVTVRGHGYLFVPPFDKAIGGGQDGPHPQDSNRRVDAL